MPQRGNQFMVVADAGGKGNAEQYVEIKISHSLAGIQISLIIGFYLNIPGQAAIESGVAANEVVG